MFIVNLWLLLIPANPAENSLLPYTHKLAQSKRDLTAKLFVIIQHRFRTIMINQLSFHHLWSHQFLQTVHATIFPFFSTTIAKPPQLNSYGSPSARFSVNKFRKNQNKRGTKKKRQNINLESENIQKPPNTITDLGVRRILTFVGIK